MNESETVVSCLHDDTLRFLLSQNEGIFCTLSGKSFECSGILTRVNEVKGSLKELQHELHELGTKRNELLVRESTIISANEAVHVCEYCSSFSMCSLN
jgi:hypothetical protein